MHQLVSVTARGAPYIRSQPSEVAVLHLLCHLSVERVSENQSQGHELLGLISGITEHDALITGTMVLEVTVVETLSDIWGLLLNGDKDVEGYEAALGRIQSGTRTEGTHSCSRNPCRSYRIRFP